MAPGGSPEPTAPPATGSSTTPASPARPNRPSGLIGTLSSSYNDPVELARRLGDLDFVSGGRFGWSVVTTAGVAGARNFGRPVEPDHAARYRRAAEVGEQLVAAWGRRGVAVSPQGRPVVVHAADSREVSEPMAPYPAATGAARRWAPHRPRAGWVALPAASLGLTRRHGADMAR